MIEGIKSTDRRLFDICAGLVEPTTYKPVEMLPEGF